MTTCTIRIDCTRGNAIFVTAIDGAISRADFHRIAAALGSVNAYQAVTGRGLTVEGWLR